MAKMSFGCNTELVFVSIMLALFLTFNIGLNYWDNWVLSPGPYPAGLGFPAPLVYAFCHSFASLIGAIGMIYGRSGNKVTMQMFWGHKIKLVLNSLLLTTTIVIAWFVVQQASVALINVIRGAVAVPVLVFAFVLEGKRYSIPKIFTILLIVGGSVISVPFSTISYTGNGLLLTMAAALCVALKATVSGMLMKDSKRNGMTPIVVLFYDSMFSSLFFIMLEAKYEASWLNEVLPGSMSAAEINKKSDVDGTTAGEETPLNKAQDKLNKFTDASEAKKWVPKSWFAM